MTSIDVSTLFLISLTLGNPEENSGGEQRVNSSWVDIYVIPLDRDKSVLFIDILNVYVAHIAL